VHVSEIARWFDTVSVCLSKGLGAPVGSVVAGDAAFLERARLVRKRLGGWMRQAGILAAAGLIALEDGVERLGEDHRLAQDLAERVHAIPGLSAPPGEFETNIVFVTVQDPRFDAERLAARLAERGVRALVQGPRTLRCVTHLDVGPADTERLEQALRAILGARA
jgi:threonine aldolase